MISWVFVASIGCLGDVSAAAEPGGRLTAAEAIDLVLRRLDRGTGETLVSAGVPLPPGYLGAGDMAMVRVEVEGAELPIYVEPLASRHPDGTVRSILIQFRYDVGARSVRAVLHVGPGVSRTDVDLEKTAVNWTQPSAVVLPTSADYLASTMIVGPSVTVHELSNGPYRTWQARFESEGSTRWTNDDMTNVAIHQYDRALVWYAGWVRTADSEYWHRGTVAAIEYRKISEPHFSWQPHFQETQGLEVHYLLTGDERSRDAVGEIAAFMDMAYEPYIDKNPTREWMDSRIQTRVLLSSMVAGRLNVAGRDWTAKAKENLDQVLGTQSEDGAMRWEAWEDEHTVFMASLLVHSLIKYYTWVEADERIPPFVKNILDFVHPNLWVGDSWQYTSVDADPTVDLNQLNAVGYAWYGWLTGDDSYTEVAKVAFVEAAKGAWLGSWKQFNQNYRGAHETAFYVMAAGRKALNR